MAKLTLSLNGTLLNQYFIDKPTLTIGRGTGNDIVISDSQLSREHARIVTVGEDHIAEDMKSSNGTLINGSPLVRQILQHRDIIELGAYRLCYLNSRQATEVDLERTMLIKALPRDGNQAPDALIGASAGARTAKQWFPLGSVKVLAGPGHPHPNGECVRLDRVVTTFGTPNEQLVVIGRRPQGYFLTHVEGTQFPRINQQSVNREPHALHDGDQIEAAGYRLEFQLDALAGRK